MSKQKETNMSQETEGIVKKKKPMNKKLRKRIIIGGVAVVLIGFITIPKLTAKEVVPQVIVDAVARGDVESTLDTSGLVASEQTKTYFSPVNATVLESNVVVGESVEKGTKLITFDTTSLELDNQQAELQRDASLYSYQDSVNKAETSVADYSSSTSTVGSLESRVASTQQYIINLETAIETETLNIQNSAAAAAASTSNQINTYNTRLKDISIQEIDLQNDLAADQSVIAALAAKEEAYIASLETSGASETAAVSETATPLTEEERAIYNEKLQSVELINQALSTYAKEKIEINSVISALGNSTGQTSSTSQTLIDLQTELKAASNNLNKLQTELSEQKSLQATSEAGILSNEQKAQLEANSNLSELTALSAAELVEKGKEGIKAEFGGIISNVQVVEGSSAMQGAQLFTIASNEDVSVEISVSKYDFEKVALDQKATITIAGNTYNGTVSSISKIATTNESGAPVINVKIHIDNPDDNIFLGVEGKVSIEIAKSTKTLLIPAEAINVGKDGSFCYVVENGIVVTKIIETGISSDVYTEILSGLKEGDLVVTDLTSDVAEGMKVTPVESSGMVVETEAIEKTTTKSETETETETQADSGQ